VVDCAYGRQKENKETAESKIEKICRQKKDVDTNKEDNQEAGRQASRTEEQCDEKEGRPQEAGRKKSGERPQAKTSYES
jgi:hypothetical protein